MSFLLIVITTYLTVIAAQFHIIEDPHGSGNYYLTSEEYKDDPKARIHLNKGDTLLRKVVSPDGERDLYVGHVKFLGRTPIERMGGLFKSHTTKWEIAHTDSEIRTAASIGTKIPPTATATGRKTAQTWLNEDPYWDFGYALDAINSVGYEYINTGTDPRKNYKGEFIEKEDGTIRVWKTKRGHPKEPWNKEDIGKDPRKSKVVEGIGKIGEFLGFGGKKSKKGKNANIMGYDALLQDYYYEDNALVNRLLRYLERDREEIESLKEEFDFLG